MTEIPPLVLRDAILSERDSEALRDWIADVIKRTQPLGVIAHASCPTPTTPTTGRNGEPGECDERWIETPDPSEVRAS